ncbi:DUF3467 domain-containing protein [Patescibacteria group bacterium]|nr:DUF3467 domain-containing protein [Patescibacteria group bacterium]MBU1721472.1 DUF3467 domain-containing protein [Patescibacteria group bacterium]MBU1900771.1 DUF3467 domain-containing protein [Patescibacteria group bacterium]
MTQENKKNQKQLQIKANDEVLAGNYANAVQIVHTEEEFVLDFMSVFPPAGTLNNRSIISPAHAKRLLVSLQKNIDMYEKKFGVIKEAQGPDTVNGFPVR